MMLTVRKYNSNGDHIESIEIPIDDYTFNAIMSQGRVVSKPDHSVYRDILLLSPAEHNFVFKMTLLEASKIFESNPDFQDTGILGTWMLSTNGFLKLVKVQNIVHDVNAERNILDFLQSPNSSDFVRKLYV
jgi:hypothetical protein